MYAVVFGDKVFFSLGRRRLLLRVSFFFRFYRVCRVFLIFRGVFIKFSLFYFLSFREGLVVIVIEGVCFDCFFFLYGRKFE